MWNRLISWLAIALVVATAALAKFELGSVVASAPAALPIARLAHGSIPRTLSLRGIIYSGTQGRNILVGPGTKQFDLSLFKDIPFREDSSRRLQFRAEAFNVLNTPQFNNPNAQIEIRQPERLPARVLRCCFSGLRVRFSSH